MTPDDVNIDKDEMPENPVPKKKIAP